MGGRLSTEAIGLVAVSLVVAIVTIVIAVGGINIFSNTAERTTSISGIGKIIETTDAAVYDNIRTPYSDASNTIVTRQSVVVFLPQGEYAIKYDSTGRRFYFETITSSQANESSKYTAYYTLKDEYIIRETVYKSSSSMEVKECTYKVFFEGQDQSGNPATVYLTVDTSTEYTVLITVTRMITGTGDSCTGVIKINYSFESAKGHIIKIVR